MHPFRRDRPSVPRRASLTDPTGAILLGEFASRCLSTPGTETSHVRGLHALLVEIAPKLSEIRFGLDNRRIESLLAVSATLSAAMQVKGPDIGVMVSEAPNGTAIATAWIPGRSEEQTITSDTPVTALCAAVALACAQALGNGPAAASGTLN